MSSLKDVQDTGDDATADPAGTVETGFKFGLGLTVLAIPAILVWRFIGSPATGFLSNMARGVVNLGQQTAQSGEPGIDLGRYT